MRIGARRCSVAVLVLCVFLTPALLSAAPVPVGERAVAERAGGGLLEVVRSLLSVLWGENGSGADPNGTTTTGDNGSGFDPNGNHVTGDNGSGADPDGRL